LIVKDYCLFSNTNISQGSVATRLRCGEIFSEYVIANAAERSKELRKSVNRPSLFDKIMTL